MLSDKKYGLSVNMMATRVLPSLLPQTVNPSLNLEQFMILHEVSIFQTQSRFCHCVLSNISYYSSFLTLVVIFCCRSMVSQLSLF